MGSLALKTRRGLARWYIWLTLFSLGVFAFRPFSAGIFTGGQWRALFPAQITAITPENAAHVQELHSLTFNPWELVLALAWSPDGTFLAASVGVRLVLLEADSLEVVQSIEIGAFSRGLAFNTQGNLLALGSQDGLVRIWQVQETLEGTVSMIQMAEYQAHRKGVNTLVFSPLEDILITGGNDAVVRLWQPLSGELLQQIIGGTYAVPAAMFIPRMNSLALVNGDVIRLRDAEAGNIVGTFRYATWFYSLAYHPMQDLLAAGDIHNRVAIWSLDQAYRSGQERTIEPRFLVGHLGKDGTYRSLVWSVAFNADGSLLASAGGDGRVILWDMDTFSIASILKGHERGVCSVAFAPGGELLASGGLDGSIRLWGLAP